MLLFLGKWEKNGRAILIVGAGHFLTSGLCLYWDKCPYASTFYRSKCA